MACRLHDYVSRMRRNLTASPPHVSGLRQNYTSAFGFSLRLGRTSAFRASPSTRDYNARRCQERMSLRSSRLKNEVVASLLTPQGSVVRSPEKKCGQELKKIECRRVRNEKNEARPDWSRRRACPAVKASPILPSFSTRSGQEFYRFSECRFDPASERRRKMVPTTGVS